MKSEATSDRVLPRPRARTNGVALSREPLEPTPGDLDDWSRGAAALARMPSRRILELTEGIGEIRARALAELGDAYARIDWLRLGARERLQGMPLPVCAAGAPRPEAAGEYLVADFLKPGITMVAGEEGSGKSFVIRQLAVTAVAGLPHFLVERYAIARKLRVLLVDEDNGEPEEWARTEQVCAQLDVDPDRLINLHRVSLAGAQLDQERWQHWLLELVDELAADVVILDPISEMHGGEELRRDPSFRALLRFLKRLKVERPTLAVVLVHHVRKSPAGERAAVRALRDVRGQWGQTPDVVAVLSPLGGGRARWELHKRVPRSSLVLEQSNGIFRCVAEEDERRASRDERILTAVDAGATTVDQIVMGCDLKERTVWNGVKALRSVGILDARGPLRRVNPEDAE